MKITKTWAVVAITLLSAIVAAVYLSYPQFAKIVSIEHQGEMEVGKAAHIIVQSDQPIARAKKRRIIPRIEGNVVSQEFQLITNSDGNTDYDVSFVPKSPSVNQEVAVVLLKDEKEIARSTTPLTVQMPKFYGDEQTFMEMVTAPDNSVYGSHITVWNDLHDTDVFTVTGHAASNVCRVASAALFGLGQHSDNTSDYFFLGAGMGSLDVRGLETSIDELESGLEKEFPEIWEQLSEVAKQTRNPIVYSQNERKL